MSIDDEIEIMFAKRMSLKKKFTYCKLEAFKIPMNSSEEQEEKRGVFLKDMYDSYAKLYSLNKQLIDKLNEI